MGTGGGSNDTGIKAQNRIDMNKRFVSLYFPHLKTDWLAIRKPELRNTPLVLAAKDHNRAVITAASPAAEKEGLCEGMVVADARALLPELLVLEDRPNREARLLRGLGEWCIRWTPVTGVDGPDGLILDVSGCAHLWGGEEPYLKEILRRIRAIGYHVRGALADTMLAAWAVARYGKGYPIIAAGAQSEALGPLPCQALRLDAAAAERLQQLGLAKIDKFISMPRGALRRRFGPHLLHRLDEALGTAEESLEPICPVAPFAERLPCLEPIQTRTGIEIALQRLLNQLCGRLQQEGKGLRTAIFKGYRVDGKMETVEISTTRATHQPNHLFALFDIKLSTIEPALGIELFLLEAPKVEEASPAQTTLWSPSAGLEDNGLAALLDRLVGKFGAGVIHRYLPEERHWPERSFREATDLRETPATAWSTLRPRPVRLLPQPEPIQVTAPIPDYPPMLFRYKGVLHKTVRADGPERIEREWWIDQGPHRDYYTVEDEAGGRYWLFRSGHYRDDNSPHWFIHGFFA
jgi:protein ImuB